MLFAHLFVSFLKLRVILPKWCVLDLNFLTVTHSLMEIGLLLHTDFFQQSKVPHNSSVRFKFLVKYLFLSLQSFFNLHFEPLIIVTHLHNRSLKIDCLGSQNARRCIIALRNVVQPWSSTHLAHCTFIIIFDGRSDLAWILLVSLYRLIVWSCQLLYVVKTNARVVFDKVSFVVIVLHYRGSHIFAQNGALDRMVGFR